MRAIVYPIAIAIAFALSLTSAAAQAATSPTQTLVDIETKWSKAFTTKDTAAIAKNLADDWSGQFGDGSKVTKAEMVDIVKTGKLSITKMTNHDVTARVFGDIGVVQGMDDETSSYMGKDTSGTYNWTDVFQKRNGKWLAVASQTGPVKK